MIKCLSCGHTFKEYWQMPVAWSGDTIPCCPICRMSAYDKDGGFEHIEDNDAKKRFKIYLDGNKIRRDYIIIPYEKLLNEYKKLKSMGIPDKNGNKVTEINEFGIEQAEITIERIEKGE